MSKDKRSKKKLPEKSVAKKKLLAYKSEGKMDGLPSNLNSSTINKRAS